MKNQHLKIIVLTGLLLAVMTVVNASESLSLTTDNPINISALAGVEKAAETMSSAERPAMDYVATLFVFMLATFVGLEVIRRVSRLLHTPLMSLTNAISAIAVVGSILIAGQQHQNFWINLLGLVAVTASVTNIVSGFLITDRMLKMFKKKESPKHE